MILGIEVRKDSAFAVAVDEAGSIQSRSRQEGTSPSVAAAAVLGVLAGKQPDAIGIAVGDPLDEATAQSVTAIAAAAVAAKRPRIVTRGCALALAEQWRGCAEGARNVVALTVAESVQSGLVLNGVPFEGAHGLAGSAAWLALNPVEREDYRRFGSLQAEIGARGIVRRLVWRIKSGDESSVLEMAGGEIGKIQVHHVFDASRAGDGVAVSVVRDTARYIGMAIANLVVLADPDIVVVGGLVAEAADQLLQSVQSEAARRLPKRLADALIVSRMTLGDDAGPLGAARAAMIAT